VEGAGRFIGCHCLHLLVFLFTSKLKLSLLIDNVGWLLRGLVSKLIKLNGLKLLISLFQVSVYLEKLRGTKATLFKDLSAILSSPVL